MAKVIGKEDASKKAGKDEGVADISGNLTSDTFLQSVQEMAAVNAKMKSVNEERKKVRKTIKARGIELGDLDAVVRMSDWDREEVRASFDRRRRYAEWLGLPIAHQADMFKGLTQEQKSAAEWEATGRTAYLAAKGPQPPEDCPDPFRLNWMRGYKLAAGETPPEDKKKKPVDERAAAKARTKDDVAGLAPEPDPVSEAAFAEEDAAARAKREAKAAQDANVLG
jgi:hypothetical protein